MKTISPFIQHFLAAVAILSASYGLWLELDNFTLFQAYVLPQPVAVNLFDSLSIEAKAAFVYEPDIGRVLYAKSEHERLPIASLTKVMSALVASEFLPESTIVQFPDLPDRHYRLKDLVALTLISSSNNGALALATATQDSIGQDLVTAMNAEAKRLNLTQTVFTNSTGLDLNSGAAGSYSSVYDIAHLFVYILSFRPELLASTRFKEIEVPTVEGLRHRFENTNEILSDLPGLLGSKTGFTDAAAGTLAIAFDRGLNQPVGIVVLGSTESGRFTDVKSLVDTVIKTYLLS